MRRLLVQVHRELLLVRQRRQDRRLVTLGGVPVLQRRRRILLHPRLFAIRDALLDVFHCIPRRRQVNIACQAPKRKKKTTPHAAGARTFQSAASLELGNGPETFKTLDISGLAADRNVRAPSHGSTGLARSRVICHSRMRCLVVIQRAWPSQ